jgi:hypothetical protein
MREDALLKIYIGRGVVSSQASFKASAWRKPATEQSEGA